ncbi:MAG: dihydroxyacetone kinase subunit DhaL [Spirochaetaceae bacterium]|nr:dihydroxyacetone kinase subunit DhaL [Spirochaetaceae bacterium]MDT8296779.1 dihydroxyacetone kinase subunit DhaL [Spirochaetaceae bacterium]
MGNHFANANGRIIVEELIRTIHENREYLSDIDGKIGDGDHGINMDKGFQLTASRLEDDMGMSDALKLLGRTLLLEIGGSMGPLYGQYFKAMAKVSQNHEEIGTEVFADMLDAAYEAIRNLGEAKPGDKTLVDTLDPAAAAMRSAVDEGLELPAALDRMVTAAETGWKSTEDMVAKIGRSSRLGERSRGVLDAGATSCCLMLKSMAKTMTELAD